MEIKKSENLIAILLLLFNTKDRGEIRVRLPQRSGAAGVREGGCIEKLNIFFYMRTKASEPPKICEK